MEKEENESWSAVINKNKRKISAKRVSFHKKLIQDSPVHKSRPRELSSMIKIGAIFCPLTTDSCNVLRKSSIFSDYERGFGSLANQVWDAANVTHGDHGDAPIEYTCSSTARRTDVLIQKVFQNLKRDLHINTNLDQAANTQPSTRFNVWSPPQGERFSFFPNHTTRLCFRCSSPAHLVKDCRGRLVVFTASIMIIGLVTVSRDN